MEIVKIGIDIGGTNVRMGVVKNLKVIKSFTTKNNKYQYENILNWILEKYNLIKEKYIIEKVGVCVPGPLNLKEGIILESPNLPGWNGINIKKIISEKIEHEININNDANAQALAVQKIYAEKSKVLVFFTISTGIGCGIIINGKIFNGAHGFAAEVANLNINDDISGYGSLTNGSVESIASGEGLERIAKTINESYKTKDVFSNNSLKHIKIDGEKALAKLLNAATSFLDPDTIIFSGSVAIKNKSYIINSLKIYNQQIFKVVYGKQKIIFASVKKEYGIIGASLI